MFFFREVSRLKRGLRVLDGGLRGDSRVFQRILKVFSRLFIRCLKHDSRGGGL